MKRLPTQQERLFEREQSVNLTVISPGPARIPCPACGARQVLFTCHAFRAPGSPIVDLCKACAIHTAGSEEHVWVKTTWQGLRSLWQRNQRPDQPAQFKNAPPRGGSERV